MDKNVNIYFKKKGKICQVRNTHLNAKYIGVDAHVYKYAGIKPRVLSFEIGILYSQTYRCIKIADITRTKNYSIMQNYVQI